MEHSEFFYERCNEPHLPYMTFNACNKSYTENIIEAPAVETVCWCSSVSKQVIMAAIAGGARNMEDVRRMTGACTQGRCKEVSPRRRCCSVEIMALLDAVARENTV